VKVPKFIKSIAIAAGVITVTFWGGSEFFSYMNERESVERVNYIFARYQVKAETISCKSNSAIDSEVDCTFKMNREQFFNLLKAKKLNRDYIKINISAENVEELKSKTFKTDDGGELYYRFGNSSNNKFCEDLLTPKTSSKVDLYVLFRGHSDLYYVSQTETGCIAIIHFFKD
jgi:hypothetical protein